MTRRTRIAAVVAVVAVAASVVGLWLATRGELVDGEPRGGSATHRPANRPADGTSSAAATRPPVPALPRAPAAGDASGDVTIAGRVFDIAAQHPVGNVEVVFRGAAGELTTTARSDGAYAIRLAPGSYRAFVRGEMVLSVGRPDRVRLPAPPPAETAGTPDEALMTIVHARGDTDGVDLSVVRGGVVNGIVVDRSGNPIAGAMVRARGGLRPTLGTDIAETDNAGRFELRLPAGRFQIDAHHARFAGTATLDEARISVQPATRQHITLMMTAGCVIAGRVIGPDGKPAGDGAIEKQYADGEHSYQPAGRIEPNGAFRWTTTEEADVTLRAWPWKSPASPGKQFTCKDGARFTDVVFQLPAARPDIEGELVDASGAPVGFAFVDLAPLDPDGVAQQERADANGQWQVYNMPPGRYRVTARAEGRGIVTQTVKSPEQGIVLTLGGTGRLEGTATRLVSGSFELASAACADGGNPVPLQATRQLVAVTAGRFAIDDLPACELTLILSYRGKRSFEHVAIPSGGTAHLEVDLGPPHPKTVHGVVRDGGGAVLAGAIVTATAEDRQAARTQTNAAGEYTLETASGAQLHALAQRRAGLAKVGGANVDRERVDIIVDEDAADVELPP